MGPDLGGRLAQLARALASHARGHWFKSSIAHHFERGPAIRASLSFGQIGRPLAALHRPRGVCYFPRRMSTDPILIELAREDALLFQMRQQVGTLPTRIAGLDDDKKRIEQQILDAEALYEKAEKERRKLETELQDVKSRRAKSEARQSALTSTDQYNALMKEIQQQDARIDQLESSVLDAMERSEQAAKRRDGEIRRFNDELQRIGSLQEQLRRDLETARAGIEEQSKKRDAAVSRIEPRTRSLYERVLRAKGDAAIALVQDRTCGICNALQPPQVIQILRGNSPTLQQCQVCGRILVWDPTAA